MTAKISVPYIQKNVPSKAVKVRGEAVAGESWRKEQMKKLNKK